jgi:tetratricopeptide (TPR) repeat protein
MARLQAIRPAIKLSGLSSKNIKERTSEIHLSRRINMNISKTPFIFLAATLVALAIAPLAPAANPTATGHATKGVQLAQQGAFDQAVEEFTKAIEADPKDARFYRDRGGVYLTMKRFQDAVNDFTKAIELAPKEYTAYSLRGAGQSELLQLDPAMADLNKALEMKPNDPQTLERRGLVFYRQKNYQAALDDYNNALGQNPTSALGLSRRADAFVALSQFDKAVLDLEAITRQRPDDVSAQDRLNFVKQRLAQANAPRPSTTVAVTTAVPTPVAKPMDPRMKIAIGAGGLIVLAILIIIIVRKKSRGY